MESKLFSVIARIFSLPLIIAGIFLLSQAPDFLIRGGLFLAIGLTIFGYKYSLIIDKEKLMTTVGIYQLVFKKKHIKMTEFSNIHLGAGSITTGHGHVSSPPFRLSFSYKNPDNYISGDLYKPKGFSLDAFTKFSLKKWNQNNFDNLSNHFIKDMSELTGLPIEYSKEVKQSFLGGV